MMEVPKFTALARDLPCQLEVKCGQPAEAEAASNVDDDAWDATDPGLVCHNCLACRQWWHLECLPEEERETTVAPTSIRGSHRPQQEPQLDRRLPGQELTGLGDSEAATGTAAFQKATGARRLGPGRPRPGGAGPGKQSSVSGRDCQVLAVPGAARPLLNRAPP